MIRLRVPSTESLDKTLRQFKKLCNNSGLFKDMKKHTHYEKPSEKRRRQGKERLNKIKKMSNQKSRVVVSTMIYQ